MTDTRALTEDEREAMERAYGGCGSYEKHEVYEHAFIAGLHYRDGEDVAILDEAEEFIERVTQWTGSDPDERGEMLRRFAALSAARKASP